MESGRLIDYRLVTRVAIVLMLLVGGTIPVPCQVGLDAASQWMTFGKPYAPKKDHGHSWGVDGTIDITSEFGLLLGIGPAYTRYAYRTDPFLYRTSLVGAVAIPSWRYKLIYTLFMPSVSNRLALELRGGISTAEVIQFYGFGSDTPRDWDLEETGYYDVNSTVYGALFYVGYGLTPSLWIGPAVGMNYMDLYNSEGRLIGEMDPDLVGADRLYLGPGIQLHRDTRELSLYPRSGTYLFAGAHTWFATAPGRTPYHQISADCRWYGTVTRIPDFAVALRLYGLTTFGEVPFYHMARLGGRKSLRGYEFERFRGDHMIAVSSEARFPLLKEVIVIPIEFGGFVMADGGRLWYEGESPGGWRATWGLGIWGATLSREVLGILYLAFSGESTILRAGFGFDY
jgi:hypothetical protein